MDWTIALLIVGLICSICAFGVAIRGVTRTFKLISEERSSIESLATPVKPEILEKIGESLRSAIISFILATAILYMTVVGTSAFMFVTAHTNQNALCALRGNLEQEAASSRNYLKEHPNGLPKLGISAATIEEGIKREERSINALSELSC